MWDIDVIIRRTLVYTILTVILALMYVGLVFVFGSLLRSLFGQQKNPVVIVASTLIIAALFQPLHHDLQRVIDRRFYRSKYGAAKTLKDFSETLYGEIDLEELSKHLVTVVQETCTPPLFGCGCANRSGAPLQGIRSPSNNIARCSQFL